MKTILIADDHPVNLELLATLFRGEDTLLLQAGDGRQALALAQKDRPDLIITDILMPHMNGVELVQRLRSDASLADVPVIFYTAAYREGEARALAVACGVNRVLAKPAEPEEILALAGEALGTRLSRDEDIESTSAAASGRSMPGLQGEMIEHLSQMEIAHVAIAELLEGGHSRASDRDQLLRMSRELTQSMQGLQSVSLRLTPLIELGLELAAERDPARLLDIVCRAAQNVCVCRFVVTGVFDSEGNRLKLAHVRGLSEDMPPWLFTAEPLLGNLASVVEEKLPLRLNGLDGDATALGFPTGHPRIHSLLAVPLVVRERCLGWLYLVDKLGADGFGEREEQLALTIAAQAATAYENMALFEQVKALNASLEARVAERTAQLRIANADLNAFNTSVSHDLRAPLRAIRGFSEMLVAQHAQVLPAEARGYLGHIVDSGRRMDLLIDEMLAYARMGSESVALEAVSLDLVMRGVADGVASRIAGSRSNFVVDGPMPAVVGHPALLLQAFMNLADNAFKYSREDVIPRVVVGCTEEGRHVVVTVRDNGIGIAPEHRERVFGMFTRLQTQRKTPGTGIGLALVKKAVEKMRGEVWVDSIVGTGSIFSVRLVKAPPAR